jgi:DNA-binding transcriptional MerR regulator
MADAKRRKRQREGVYSSCEIAQIIGVTKRTLLRMLASGRVPEPMRNPKNHYRIWTEADVIAIREALPK